MKHPFCIPFALAALAGWLPHSSPAQDVNPAAGTTTSPNESSAEGFVIVNNRVHVVSQGVARPLDHEMTLRVTPTGLIGFDQTPRIITNNTMLTMDGHIVGIPRDLAILAPEPTATADAADVRSGSPYVVSGTNYSGLSPRRALASPAGPRFVSAKKPAVVKARSSTAPKSRTISAKRAPVTKTAPIAATFNDGAILPLPNVEIKTERTEGPSIDATSTMLYMTAAPDPAWSPESESLRASAGLTAPTSTAPAPATPSVFPTPGLSPVPTEVSVPVTPLIPDQQ